MMKSNDNFQILVVDDTPKNLQLLMTILSAEKYTIHVAQDGVQALKKAQAIKPDLILLDVNMPEMDGFETCKQLKSSPATEEIPVIFLTARTETEDIVKGFELGAVDYVTKPFN
jgi:DNA-binding response OmpR family regulator